MRIRRPAPAGVSSSAPSTDDEDHRIDVLRTVPRPHHRLLDDPERDRCQRDRREPFHAADDRGRERAQEYARAEHGADRQSDDSRPQEHREEREERGQHPHQRVDPTHRDAEQRGAVGVVGAPAHRDPEARAQEQRDPDEREWDHDHRDHVVARETDRVDGERHVERRGEALRRGVDREPAGSSKPAPARTCASPMVATVRIRRGARKKRRTRRSSTSAPSANAAIAPVTNATAQLAPLLTISRTANEPGTAPRSP